MISSAHRMVLHAISFAARHHRHQLRKDDKTPYIAHPNRVMSILVLEFGIMDPEVLTAAVLHDTIEDTTADFDEVTEHFGERVASLVAALTKDKRLPEPGREEAFLDQLAAAPIEARLIKLADTTDNLIDSSTTIAGRPSTKTLQKARAVMERFSPGFPEEWRHALQIVQRLIDEN